MRKAILLVASLASLSIWHHQATAAPLQEVMASRYMKYNFCMEAAFGQGWRKKYKVSFGMNRWGVSEPTEQGITSASQGLRDRDAKCRSANEIVNEPRPRQEFPEKHNPD